MTPFSVNPLFLRGSYLSLLFLLCGPVRSANALPAQSAPATFLTIVEEQKVRGKSEISQFVSDFRGDESLLERRMPPASLFKVLIARLALRDGVIAPTHEFAVESTFPSVHRSLRWVLFFSSNLAFDDLGRRVGADALRREVHRTGFLVEPLSADFGQDRSFAWFRGGEEGTTPRRVQAYFRALSVTGEMDEYLQWPGECVIQGEERPATGRISAKSGAWGGAAWMAGYCRAGDRLRVVTVLVAYRVPAWKVARREAIGRFYEAMGSQIPPEAPL